MSARGGSAVRASGSVAGGLSVVDSLTEQPTRVRPGAGGRVNLYVCGPTVYAPAHVGHARTYLYFDIARRVLETDGMTVRHVMNVTDVEDKIDRRAAALGVSSVRLARAEERNFFRDLGALGVEAPRFRPRAGDYVPQMVRVGRALERTGRVRHEGDEWIFDPEDHPRGANFPTGAELARHVVPEAGQTFTGGNGRDRAILVWKRQDPPLPSWPSPWGHGVPGWHLECFAMASELLGVPVDLHGGARDLVYPHHFAENEIALALRRARFSRVFLHTGFVLQHGAKMSKSTGNLVSLRSVLDRTSPGALRWYLLSRPPRDRLPWDERDLAHAAEEYSAVRALFGTWTRPGASGSVGADRAADLAERTARELSDGLRVDRALETLVRFAEELGKTPNPRAPRGERIAVRTALRGVGRRIGIPLV